MNKLLDSDFEILDKCPWDNSPAETAKFLYQDDMGAMWFAAQNAA